jgi:uncharacterized lipoprotein YajG
VRCTEWGMRLGAAGLSLLAGCSAPPSGTAVTPSSGAAPTVAARTEGPSKPADARPTSALAAAKASARLPEPRTMRSWDAVRQQAAERMVAANPDGTYVGTVPEALLAIPVLEIELNGDGSVRRVGVLRAPRQAKDTVAIATAAVHSAAPFGNVSRLPKPWKFVETFLFDDERRFKPRTLDP